MLKKCISTFAFVVVFLSMVVVMIHHKEIQNGVDIKNFTFTQIITKLKEYNENSELGKNYLPSLSYNLNEVKRYIKGQYFGGGSSSDISSLIQNDLDIQNSKNFFERLRLSLTNGYNAVRSFFGASDVSSSSQSSLDVLLSFAVGFIPTLSALAVINFQVACISLDYIAIFLEVVL